MTALVGVFSKFVNKALHRENVVQKATSHKEESASPIRATTATGRVFIWIKERDYKKLPDGFGDVQYPKRNIVTKTENGIKWIQVVMTDDNTVVPALPGQSDFAEGKKKRASVVLSREDILASAQKKEATDASGDEMEREAVGASGTMVIVRTKADVEMEKKDDELYVTEVYPEKLEQPRIYRCLNMLSSLISAVASRVLCLFTCGKCYRPSTTDMKI